MFQQLAESVQSARRRANADDGERGAALGTHSGSVDH
jgi:hypothetical protein